MTPARKQNVTDALLAVCLAALIVLGVRAHAPTPDAPLHVTGGCR